MFLNIPVVNDSILLIFIPNLLLHLLIADIYFADN
jgi:hypothetical protein